MSYHVWSTYGYGFCVDGINTTPEKILTLASLNEKTLSDLRKYLSDYFEGEYKDEELELEDFAEFEGHYGDRGISCILREVINNELPIVFADNFDGVDYILYCPAFPWDLSDKDKYITEDDVREIFSKYIRILTDEPIVVDYYNVANGG